MGIKDRPEGISHTAVEAAPGLWRIDLQKHDLSIPGWEVVQTRVEFTPESPPFKHSHPGEEIILVLQGSLEYQIDGRPPVVCRTGDALTVPYGVHHQARNVGDDIAVELATYVVEKGKPLLTKIE
ncbi:Cupin domain-containing protein [Micromonospora phaseoli]|uniref:Cupin domain-containing protein n=1 Tax=Micromonospora phaseoli TaxID=1144548 RepID=A0A1H7C1S1_9ACTN|nr:cupin domain-containing protein [Micromonospora phaseoli]PZV92698.1 Cupin domain-containing protein [Micromonospora phaseoli]GIJ76648.1 cupin [Micromonospora phaseoli]SEJ83234.1 Cupin domain-containing protein [Micromonospora phaseoli]